MRTFYISLVLLGLYRRGNYESTSKENDYAATNIGNKPKNEVRIYMPLLSQAIIKYKYLI